MKSNIRRATLSFTVLTCIAVSRVSGADVNFARQILPILSNKCFTCHGPDAAEDQLRLDSFAAAAKDLGGYRAVNPDLPDESEILVRIALGRRSDAA